MDFNHLKKRLKEFSGRLLNESVYDFKVMSNEKMKIFEGEIKKKLE